MSTIRCIIDTCDRPRDPRWGRQTCDNPECVDARKRNQKIANMGGRRAAAAARIELADALDSEVRLILTQAGRDAGSRNEDGITWLASERRRGDGSDIDRDWLGRAGRSGRLPYGDCNHRSRSGHRTAYIDLYGAAICLQCGHDLGHVIDAKQPMVGVHALMRQDDDRPRRAEIAVPAVKRAVKRVKPNGIAVSNVIPIVQSDPVDESRLAVAA